MSLFQDAPDPADDSGPQGADVPLAERMRPRTLDEVLGQGHVLDPEGALVQAITTGQTGSLLLWGPPGVGKTTLARLIAKASGTAFAPFSAVLSGVKEVREAVATAKRRRRMDGQGTLLFVDEIHRFNKAQQDAFLPHVEDGTVVLVGATTENPSFSVNAALLSRCRVVALEPLPDEAVRELVATALADAERGLGARGLTIAVDGLDQLVLHAGGDARRALTALEAASRHALDGEELSGRAVLDAMQHRALVHDKSGDHHFDLLSALHKSLRNSDAQAAVYWLARLVSAGADPVHAARRMVAMAAEDIGLADPMALQVAVAAVHAAQMLGWPEAKLPLTEAALYLAAAPKSNSVVTAINAALEEVQQGVQHPVPAHLRNAPTRLAKEMGHGKGYRYAHDKPGGVAPMDCLPEPLVGRNFYRPGKRGFEAKVRDRLAEVERLRRQKDT